MPVFIRRLATCLLLASVLVGCSTPGKRAQQRPEAFHRLSPSDQRLVMAGHTHTGMNQDAAYIAWGEPDSKTTNGRKDGATTETWVYRQRVTLTEPINSYDYTGPYPGYGDLPLESRWRPGFGLGGIGYEGLPQLQPHVRDLDTTRSFVFWTPPTTLKPDFFTKPHVAAKKHAPAKAHSGKNTGSKVKPHAATKAHPGAKAHAGPAHGKAKTHMNPRHLAHTHGSRAAPESRR